MKSLSQIIIASALFTGFVLQSSAALIVDDTWADGSRINTPIGAANSVWFADNTASLTASTGSMVGTPDAATSRQWETHFTADSASIADLAVGDTLTVTLVFTPTGTGTATSRGLRIGLYSYADGGTRITTDGSTPVKSSGANVPGYFTGMNFSQSLIANPIEFRARTNLASINLMGTTADYTQVTPSGPASPTGGFADGTSYTLTIAVKRNASSVDLTTTITGGSLNISHTVTDSTFLYHRFDTFALRANTTADTATSLTFTRFKVETSSGGSVSPIPVNASLNGGNIVLSWSNPAFVLQASPLVQGTYTNVPNATSPYSTPATGTQTYFRLRAN